ncbi:MAG TPA: FumA C-terminus/TtdB family hydratase beta subunit [bacterium]|uniref:Fumarate hydratase class I, anaerobic n=1 Tax=candidate division TA06 bacterium ADurb.Bin417 TaxID=1852828 RepID=A0A1V5MK69_UNCT6|nr:MAG: Fumarate hydratase class I, anaerobic [candidate division TA06 bacterium ADurb.Bin417]HNQ34715.1 FumA C-terminus/TtdB family hydratase beta subunit [bacterium]HNS48649.1 FumA C-terminus/TtdB family hydratase beta subunit [bacterium]
MKTVTLPMKKEDLAALEAGQEVLLSGPVYTARDRVHKIIFEEITRARRENRQPKLPFPLRGQTIYYCGPTPTPPGQIIGAAGPTTSSRMDPYTPILLEAGLQAVIGKGKRSPEVQAAFARFGAVYFITYGGCGALLASHVFRVEPIAFPELGPEAVWKLDILDFPARVGIDARGGKLRNL